MKRALVVGSGPRVWQDVETARHLCSWDAIYCVNRAGIHWPGERFVWVTLHHALMPKFIEQRQRLRLHSDYDVVLPGELSLQIKNIPCRFVYYRWRLPRTFTPSGSSGLFAVKVALDDGASHVVLTGVPMSTEPHFDKQTPWNARDAFIPGWRIAWPFYKDKTRSLSGGWTEELLGRPMQEWLNDEQSYMQSEFITPTAQQQDRGFLQRLNREKARRRA